MNRTTIKDLKAAVGQEVSIAGWVDVRRDHGKLIFFDIRDATGKVQAVALPNHPEAKQIAETLRSEWVVRMTGNVNARPPKMVKNEEANGGIEFEILGIEVLSAAKELPFELNADINIDTYLDNLPLTLRAPKHAATFKVQAVIAREFRAFFNSQGFTEFQAPKLIGDDAEGGANSFDVEYFKHTAHLAQSPQLYKQIMVGVLERVFALGNVYRAEKHSTTRHLNEYTSMDIEMGFIKDHHDVMNIEGAFMSHLMKVLAQECAAEFKLLGATIPTVPEQIPFMTLREAQQLITKETGKDCTNEPDLEPEHERWLCTYASEKLGSDFIFITHFPTAKRPFYTYRDEKDPAYTKGFDLLFRGVEITTGAQRIHNYDDLVQSMKDKKLDPEKFSYYLQAFKYGLPPHGGFGMGLERLTAKLLGIDNVKEAALFPRDINRIDNLLSK
ncbi:MAG: aspartate--tRNA(Asn) ligase [Candidatus Parcubacteria bacterium]|nr:aspartate--tRNA(Asn) ligase [Candidatus Parcubacteria bacterium]